MMTRTQQPIAIECTENVALLHFLHEIPEMPSTNPTTHIQSKQNGHTIPFAEERELASTLAFLAHIQDDPDHIPALCLQEIPKEKSLNIVLAVNRRSPEDGSGYVAKIKKGFERLADALQYIDDPSRNLEWDVFTLIIGICRDRILYRLRFAKKGRDGNRTRLNIIEGLQQVVDYLKVNPSKKPKLFLDRARSVLKLASSWTKHETLQQLVGLVEGVNSLRQTDTFRETLLDSIPNRAIGPSTRSHLFNMVRKVSRYRESASLLLQAARRFPLVRQMKVIIVKLNDDAFKRPIISETYSPSIHSTVSRVQNLTKPQKDVTQICGLLKTPIANANSQYCAKVKQILKSSKIHAEVQILYYCETILHGKPPSPRVICSSKSACWLCNAIISIHGKIHTPRSHGRLYPGWRLPNLYGGWCDDFALRFNQHLKGALQKSLKDLHQRREKTKHREPTESDLSTIIWPLSHFSNNQLPASITRKSNAEHINAVIERDAPKLLKTPMSKSGIIIVEEILPEDVVSEEYKNSDSRSCEKPIPTVTLISSHHPGESSEDVPQESRRNTLSYRTPLGEISSVYPSGPLKLMFEYSSTGPHHMQDSKSSKELICTTEWLSLNDVERLGLGADVIINCESLTGDEVSYSTDSANNIYLGYEGAVLKLTMQSVPRAVDAS
ncbi:hypothetical protein GGR51DRAFT_498603 [Nemania sp. FL0031]|nr:hypothetical protein GGR51DRAFT_498603 [Nemania sp. FL0031]